MQRNAVPICILVTLMACDGGSSETPTITYDPEIPGATKVFLLAGQSNMEGHGGNEDLSWIDPTLTQPRDDVFIETIISNAQTVSELGPGFGTKDSDFGPELKLGHVLGDALPEPLYFYKASKGGTTLNDADDWRPTSLGGDEGNLYAQMIQGFIEFQNTQFIDKGIDYEVAGLVWFQGENDAAEGYEASYAENLENFIAAVRADLNLPELPVIIVQINDTWNDAGKVVMEAQASVASEDEHSALVYTGDLRPFFHYASQSYVVIGDRIARAVLPFLDRPSAEHDEITIAPDGSVSISADEGVLHNDTGEELTALLVRDVEHGTLDLGSDGSFSYTPEPGYIGPDSFDYKVYSGSTGGNIARATLWVRDESDDLSVHFTFDDESIEHITDDASGLTARVEHAGVSVGHEGVVGNAAYFDGSGVLQYIDSYPIPSFLSLNTDTDFSIAVWIKPDGSTTEEQILTTNDYYYDTGPGFALTLGGEGGSLRAFISAYDDVADRKNTVDYTATDGVIDDGDWHHVCVSFAFSQDTMFLYIDGVQVGSQDITNVEGDINRFETAIGDGSESGDAESIGYQGYLDDFRVYRRALLADEVMALVQSSSIP